jgi:hypothetical protein
MYWLIIALSDLWIKNNPQRSLKHYAVKRLLCTAMQRTGLLVILGIITRFNTQGSAYSHSIENEWFARKQDLMQQDLIEWKEFADCVNWKHTMS